MSNEKTKVLLDLDTGIDDALALAYALGSPEVELAGVVSSYGNVTVGTAARNTCALLELLGHPEVPVYVGADRPLRASAPHEPSEAVLRIHGRDGLGGTFDAGWPDGVSKEPETVPWTEALRDPRLCYVPTGPLTNLATALAADSSLADALPLVSFMGGALAVPGNVTPCAEANIHSDPEAADAVLRSGLKTRMIGLDVTHQEILTHEEVAAWRGLGTSAGRIFADMAEHYLAIYEQSDPKMGGCALHDPLAMAAALDPTLVGCLGANLRVDLDGVTRGRTVCDPDRLRDAEKDCEVALTVDAPRFLKEFSCRVRRALAGC